MSIQLIQQYYNNVDKLIRYGGTRNETSLRKAFQELLDHYARSKNLLLVPEVGVMGKRGRTVHPDGTLKDALRQDWGYWESKDEKDTLEDEIRTKFSKGYPDFNILFEDTQTAVLYQGGNEIQRADFADAKALDALLTRFVSYQPQEVREFHKAIALFSAEVGGLARVLREVIEEQLSINPSFQAALSEFLELARKAINPKVEMADVREMIIQHVLTEDIFMRVFDEAEFHRENVIAHKLAEVAGTFYKGETKRNIHARIAPYYETINARASQISDHHEKQKFLKALYENFYKAYNPKAADRLGIVYTPDEIVHFMIESADYLIYKHFGKTLGDKGVEILDPATGSSVNVQPTCRLIARKEQGIIEIDTATTLRGVPAEAWEYRLGTYSALEWILEKYKEKKPKDPTIAEKFNTYRFADYKEQVIDLLQRVTTVSMETMKLVKSMP
jgi:predicted helicase